jgi:hypothetical protein
MADNTWSQNLMKDKDDNGKEITFGQNLKLIENTVRTLFCDEHFIYNCNIVYKDTLFSGVDTAHILPQTIYGLNSWMEYKNVACIEARNITLNYQRFLEAFVQLDIEEIHNVIGREFTYQSVLRGAIRDIHNHEAKRVYVVDKGPALFLADQLEGAEVIHLPIKGLREPKKAGRRRMHKSDAERKAKARSRQTFSDALVEKARDERDTYRGWSFKNEYDNLGVNPLFTEDHQHFELQLAVSANKAHEKKTDNNLICPSFFDANPRKEIM